MALEADFLNLATTTIKVETLKGHTVYGAPEFSTAASTFDAIIMDFDLFTHGSGVREEIPKTVVMVLTSSGEINLQDKITIAGSTETPRIMRSFPVRDDEGQHHWELELG